MPFNKNFNFMNDFENNDGFLKGFFKRGEVIICFAIIVLGIAISAYCSIAMKNFWLTIIGTMLTMFGTGRLARFIHIAAQENRKS